MGARSIQQSAEKHVYLFGGHTQHSLAPSLWNYSFAHLGINADYIPANVEKTDIAQAVTRLHDADVIGANITIPLKEVGARLARRPDADVVATGATNWLYSEAGVLNAANTDAIAAKRLTKGSWTQVMILGAGGGGAAVAAGVSDYASRILVTDVDGERALALRDRIRSWGTSTEAVDWGDRRQFIALSDVLVNATPLGMAGALAELSPVDPAWLSEQTHVYDLVYAPTDTPLAQTAKDLGLPLIDGLAHLYEQAVGLLPLMGVTNDTASRVLGEGIARAFAGRTPTDWSDPYD